MEKGYVQVYTGNGKGKTTAALGLAFRAAGADLKILIIQFMKGQHYSELNSAHKLNHIQIEQYGSEKFCRPNSDDFEEHKRLALKGYKRAVETIEGNKFDILVLDEIVTTTLFKILTTEDIIRLIEKKPDKMELIITGRGADDNLINAADLVTEMKEIKHYYESGVQARKGIEN